MKYYVDSKGYENKSFKELIKIRGQIIKRLKKFEKSNKLLKNDMSKYMPYIPWQYNWLIDNLDLITVTQLIIERGNEWFHDASELYESTITTENYEKLMKQIKEERDFDENLYYLEYAISYYIVTDGIGNALTGNSNANIKYSRIYGKTVRELIYEGRKLMEEINDPLEKFKKNLEKSNKNE